jgi:hypothetical protein
MKIIGAELLAFWHDLRSVTWGETWVVDGSETDEVDLACEHTLEPGRLYTVPAEARVYYDGGPLDREEWRSGIRSESGALWAARNYDAACEGWSLDSMLRKWRRCQSLETLVVTIPRDKRESFAAALKELGGRLES